MTDDIDVAEYAIAVNEISILRHQLKIARKTLVEIRSEGTLKGAVRRANIALSEMESE